jgi:hypothetical protein
VTNAAATASRSTGGQPRTDSTADGRGQPTDTSTVGKYRAVLCHNGINIVIDLREHGAKLAHDPSRDQDHPDLPGACFGKHGQRARRDLAVRQGAVEVDCHHLEVRRGLFSHVNRLLPSAFHAVDAEPAI